MSATNLPKSLDHVVLRRSELELNFRTLAARQRIRLLAHEALGDADRVDEISPLPLRERQGLEEITPGDFVNVVRQRKLLGKALEPAGFLPRLAVECQWNNTGAEATRSIAA